MKGCHGSSEALGAQGRSGWRLLEDGKETEHVVGWRGCKGGRVMFSDN